MVSELFRAGIPLDMGGYMVPIRSTKARLGDIWPQLAVSACVLLAPPLLMAAGLTYFGSPPPQSSTQAAATATFEIASTPNSLVRPDVGPGASFTAARTEQHPFVSEAPAQVDQTAALRSTEAPNDTSAADPERAPDATPKVARNEPHNGHGARRQRTLSDIFPFLRLSGR